jgi:predicted deacylase
MYKLMEYNSIFILYLCILILLILLIIIDFSYYIKPEIYTFYGENNKNKNKNNENTENKNTENKNNETLLIIAGTHGDEKTGYYGTKKIIEMINKKEIIIENGKIIIIPCLNMYGCKHNNRFTKTVLNRYIDLNRTYPDKHPLSILVSRLVKESDVVLDLHDARDKYYSNINNKGDMVILGKSDNSKKFGLIVGRVNPMYHKTNESEVIYGSLRWYCNKVEKPYVLLETDMSDKNTKNKRINKVVNTIISLGSEMDIIRV